MPLRSVEAATRDDAIAAAREQFGPSARVVGVRRVRSGGVLGFFATERYVAEVAPDLTNRPAVPPAARPDDVPADFSSPLASASPARARAAAPARNGAAAWAAEAGRTADAAAPVRSSSVPSSASSFPSSSAPAARSSAPAWQATSAAAPAQRPADDDRVSELASLLAAKQAETDTPTYGRSTFPKAATARPATTPTAYPAAALDHEAAQSARDADRRVLPADAPDAPSPFTAALARMVAGDKDVRQAVEEALVRPGAGRPGAGAEPRPVRPGRIEESAVPSSPARQEEEPVGDQVIAPSSSMTQTVEVPTWAAEPEVVPPSVSSREEAIAEVLRSALAQGHSDEALAGILRKVLAGASPQTALTAPEAAVAARTPEVLLEDNVLQDVSAPDVAVPQNTEVPTVADVIEVIDVESVTTGSAAPEVVVPQPAPALEVPTFEVPTFEAPVFDAPVFEAPAVEHQVFEAAFEAPVFETPVFETPAFDLSVHEAPITGATMFEVPVFETRADAPPAPAPAWVLSPATSMWGPPSMSATLWGEPATPIPATSTPIWAEVTSSEPAPAPASPVAAFPVLVEASLFDDPVVPVATEPAGEAPVAEITTEQDDVELPADDATAETAIEQTETEEAPSAEESVVEDAADGPAAEQSGELVAEELAPLLARTASDPAPMMSFDSTTIMPPLSLLPPLPGSRGRGRPPVPPTPSRRSSSSAAPTATAPAPAAPSVEPEAPHTDEAAPASAAVVSAGVWAPVADRARSSEDQPPVDRSLATVTRLPVAPLMVGPEILELPARLFEPSLTEAAAGTTAETMSTEDPAAIATGAVADRLVELGVPRSLLGGTFAEDVVERGTYAALTRALSLRLPKPPELPNGAGEVLVLVGPGIETLRTAQTLAASLRLDPDRVQWATRGDLAGLAPESSRVTTVGAAMNRRDDAAVAGTLTIVAVDAPMRADAYWTAQMLAIWNPVAVWAVVEATRKPEDLEPWLARLPQVDAIVVQDTDLSVAPAAVLRRVGAPVALLDGGRATPHRWASLLCERLENPQT